MGLNGKILLNVQPLELEVGDLCARLEDVSGETAREAEPILLGLMEELNRLAQSMDQSHKEITDEIRSLHAHGNAASAYSAPPSRPKK